MRDQLDDSVHQPVLRTSTNHRLNKRIVQPLEYRTGRDVSYWEVALMDRAGESQLFAYTDVTPYFSACVNPTPCDWFIAE